MTTSNDGTLAAETHGSRSFGDSLQLLGRVLTFRATREELHALNSYDLVTGLFFTWIVGMGRYWDNPRVSLLQHMGVGSLVYVFVLGTFLWLFIRPLVDKSFSIKKLLIFIPLTSPPAIIYAIPLQHIFPQPDLKIANEINLVFLGIVSVWRVSLFCFYLNRVTVLSKWQAFGATLLPINAIIVSLAFLNLEKVVWNIMRGVDHSTVSPNDDSYLILVMIGFLAIWTSIPIAAAYIAQVIINSNKTKKLKIPDQHEDNLL